MLNNFKKVISKTIKSTLIFTLIFSWLFQIPLSSNRLNWFQFNNFPFNSNKAKAAEIAQYTGGLLVYADGTTGTPKYKIFDDTTGFGSEQSANSVGTSAIEWIRVAASPTKNEWIIVTRDAGDKIVAQVCYGVYEGISCGATTTISATAGTHGLRNFDITYEDNSGDGLIVYGTATSDELRKIEWISTSSSWTNDAAITTTRTSGTVEWVEMTARSTSTSNQIGIAYSDSNDDVSAYRWNGTSAADEATGLIRASSSASNIKKFDVSFEGLSGDMYVAATMRTGSIAHGQLIGTSWTIGTQGFPDFTSEFADLQEPDPTSLNNDITFIGHGDLSASNPSEGWVWSGTGVSDAGNGDDTIIPWATSSQLAAVSYFSSSTYYAVAVFPNLTNADDIDWWTSDNAEAITDQTINTRTRATSTFIDLFDYPNKNKVLLITADVNSDLWADTWDGVSISSTAWTDLTSGGALETALSSAITDVVDFAFRRAPIATVPSVPIFYDSNGTNQIAFNNIRQATSSPLFRVSALASASSTKFQFELNTAPSFDGTSYTQTFTGIYASGTANNFYATNTSPALATTTGTTYYVRARASIDGINYSSWSTSTRSFTYVSSGNTDWFQTQKAQFDTGTLTGVTASSTAHSVYLNTGSSTGNIISATSTFSNFTGVNSWSNVTWSTTESGGTTSLQVYYATSSLCNTLVSNTDLSGNSTGFASSSSPLSLSGLSTTTYPTLCLKATLATTTGTVAVSLNDWAISATTTVAAAEQNTQVNYRWRNDDGLESSATYAAGTSTALSSGVYVGDRKRLRILLSNTGSTITNYRYRLEYASNSDSCAAWTTVPQSTTTGPWSMDWSYYFSDGAQTTDSTGIANPAGKTFATGYIMSYLNQTPNISLSTTSFTEVEYSVRSTSNVTPNLVYCFRVTDAGTSSVFVYSNQPQITVSVLTTNTRTGGSNTESSGTSGSNQTGGGSGGGTGSESSGSGTTTSTSTPPAGGGGGDVGLLRNINGFVFATVALSGEWIDTFWNFIKKIFSSIFRD